MSAAMIAVANKQAASKTKVEQKRSGDVKSAVASKQNNTYSWYGFYSVCVNKY
jgi:hypothetical protein